MNENLDWQAEAADLALELALVRAELDDARKDVARMNWLVANVKEEPLDLRRFNSELMADYKLKHKLPVLISTTCIGSSLGLRESIDIEMNRPQL